MLSVFVWCSLLCLWCSVEKVCLGLYIGPNIFRSLFVLSVVLLIVSFSLVECSAGCEVNNIVFMKGFGLSCFV